MDKKKNVFLKINKSKKRLDIEIEDEGEGFDYRKIPSPTDKKNLEKTHGRGIFLIKNLMDEVKFFNGGRGMIMTKYLKKE